MNATTQLENLSNNIADAIVKLVNNTGGPVTLSQVDRDVPGFAKNSLPVWSLAIHGAGGDVFIWGGMTEPGEAALRKVIYGRKVAIQFVTPLPYLLDVAYVDREDWQPIMLLPARGANMSTDNLLLRLSPQCLEEITAAAPSERRAEIHLLSPRPIRFPAEYFSVGDPRSGFSALLVMHPTAH